MANDLLARLAVLASHDPCQVPRADLLWLLTLAGLEDTHLYHTVADSAADPLLVDQGGMLQAIEWAREKR